MATGAGFAGVAACAGAAAAVAEGAGGAGVCAGLTPVSNQTVLINRRKFFMPLVSSFLPDRILQIGFVNHPDDAEEADGQPGQHNTHASTDRGGQSETGNTDQKTQQRNY